MYQKTWVKLSLLKLAVIFIIKLEIARIDRVQFSLEIIFECNWKWIDVLRLMEYSTVQPISPFDPMVSCFHYSVASAQNGLRIIQGVCEIDHMAVWTFPKGDADWESDDKANFTIILQLIRKIMISDCLEYLLGCSKSVSLFQTCFL